MNTGIHAGGGTPMGLQRTTTPGGKAIPGKAEAKSRLEKS